MKHATRLVAAWLTVGAVMLALTFVPSSKAGAETTTASGPTVQSTRVLDTYKFCLAVGPAAEVTPTCQRAAVRMTGARQPVVTGMTPLDHVSVTAGWAWYLHFGHADVVSEQVTSIGNQIMAGLAFACGLVAVVNLAASAACFVYVAVWAVDVQLAMGAAANNITWLQDLWCDANVPIIVNGDGTITPTGTCGNAFPSVFGWVDPVEISGLTLAVTYWGTPAGSSIDS